MNFDQLQSKTLDFIRFPISIGVVFIHNSYGGAIVAMQSINYAALTGDNLYDLFRLLSKNLATIATPYFFLISGYFYFRNMDVFTKEIYITKTINRIKTVLVPYLIWNILAFLIPLLTSIVKGDMSDYLLKFSDVNPLSILWNYKTYDLHVANLFGVHVYEEAPLNVPLWFLRDLFVMSLISPVVYFFVKKTKLYGISVLGLCFLTTTWFSVTGFRVSAVFLFCLGAYLGIYKLNIVSILRKYQIPIIIICIGSIILDTYYNGMDFQILFIRPLYRLAGLFTVIILGSYLLESSRIKIKEKRGLLAKSSFFIYVAHAVSILGVTIKAYTYLFNPDSPFEKAILYTAVSVTTVFICFLMYVSLRRYFPRLLNIMTGDRI
jgi:hypothetical protein